MALIDSLIAYWKLDESSGSRADSHGSNTLTDNNTVGSGTGKIGTAADFERDNLEWLSRADNTDLSTGNIDFTVQAWCNLESEGDYNVLLGRWGAAGSREYLLYVLGDRFTFSVSSNGTAQTDLTANTHGAVSLSTWYCVHAWHDSVNNVIGISVNAGAPDTSSYSSGLTDTAAGLSIGRNNDGPGGHFDGLIDEVGFWKRVLTSTERTLLYNGGNGLAYPFTGESLLPPRPVFTQPDRSPWKAIPY